jgi:phosphoglycolate phosphatase
MKEPIPIELIIFDFDGTLTDSIPPAIDAIQKTLKELELPFKTKEEINRFVGYGEDYLVRGVIESKDQKIIQKVKDLYFKYYVEEGFKKIALYPHVKKTLNFLKDKLKIIISNKKDEFIKMILDYHNLTHYFVEILGGNNSSCLKPDPCAINQTLEKYKISAQKTLFVGDMTVDIETGKNAKVLTCAVSYGFHDREKLKKLKPDYLIDDLLELKAIVK